MASGKKRVMTYLRNSIDPKIDGAYATTETQLKVGGRIVTVEAIS